VLPAANIYTETTAVSLAVYRGGIAAELIRRLSRRYALSKPPSISSRAPSRKLAGQTRLSLSRMRALPAVGIRGHRGVRNARVGIAVAAADAGGVSRPRQSRDTQKTRKERLRATDIGDKSSFVSDRCLRSG
jgi:hypothetical protein